MIADFGVAAEVADDDDFVDGCHDVLHVSEPGGS